MDGYQRDGKTGLYVPKKLAKQIGIGCPKCDQHFLQDMSHGTASTLANEFLKKHSPGGCGADWNTLDQLETRDGQVICTGKIRVAS